MPSMSVLTTILILLLWVSTAQVLWNYHKGIHPRELPTVMKRYVRVNVWYNFKEALRDTLLGVLNLIIILAHPTTYLLTLLGAWTWKLYKRLFCK